MGFIKLAWFYSLLGMPVWAWLTGAVLIGLQEVISRSKRIKALTYAQAIGNAAAFLRSTIVGKFPVVAQVLAVFAALQTPNSPAAPALTLVPPDAEKK